MKFYKIITAKVTPKTRLNLPNKFVERYGAAVPTTVMLQVPTGEKWSVEVERRVDEMWLGNGLFEFAESLCIEYGHFLVFDYDVKHALFHMVVVDTTAAEIKYPPFHCSAEKQKGKQSCSSSSLGHQEEKRSVLKADGTTVMRGRFGNETILSSDGKLWGKVQGSVTYYKNAKTEKALKRAKELIAEEPFCIIILPHSCVWQGQHECTATSRTKMGQLPLPRSFIKEYFNLEKKKVTLWSNDGRTWTVSICLPQHDKQACFFIAGWRQFAIDNDLQAGDVCKFEMIKGAENAVKVVIFRVSDDDASL